jgi:hypothetical protein
MGWGISLLVEKLRPTQMALQMAWRHKQRGSKNGKKGKKGKNNFLPFLPFLPFLLLFDRFTTPFGRSLGEVEKLTIGSWPLAIVVPKETLSFLLFNAHTNSQYPME